VICLHCTKLDFKGNGTKDHKDMLLVGFGPCRGLKGAPLENGGHATLWMGMTKQRQCGEFDQAADDVSAARAAWLEKQKQKREAA